MSSRYLHLSSTQSKCYVDLIKWIYVGYNQKITDKAFLHKSYAGMSRDKLSKKSFAIKQSKLDKMYNRTKNKYSEERKNKNIINLIRITD